MPIRLTANATSQSVANAATFTKARECIQATIQNGQLCLKLPIVGDVCVDIPQSIPNGTVAEACVEIGFPACVRLTVKVAGQTIVEEKFGACM